MDWLLGPLMRGFDRFKIVSSPRKRPLHHHVPPSYDFGELTRTELLTQPDEFYRQPEPVTELEPVDSVVLEPGILSEQYRFRSNWPLPGGHDFNDICRAWHIRRAEPSSDALSLGSMIVLPGWGRGELRREFKVCQALARGGLDSLVLTLPYHLSRSVPGSFSGEYMISADVVRTARCFQQCVAEARGVLGWLRQRTPPSRPVGILGISLGGILAHLAMTVERYDFGISLIAGGQSARTTWESPVTAYIKQDLIRAGIDLRLLERVWAAASPTRYAHQVRTRPILMLVGRYDDIVPVKHAEELWEALGRPEIRRYPVAHYSAFFYIKQIIADILDFVGRLPARRA